MAEYIDKSAFLKHLQKDPLFSLVEQYGITGVIESFPAADVQPVKHGRWIQLTQNVEPTALKCSLCGEISCCHGMYCPDCGARMDGDA